MLLLQVIFKFRFCNSELIVDEKIHQCLDGDGSCDNCDQNQWATANMKSGHCSTTASCFEGKCWAYCGSNLAGGTWCYTSKLGPRSGQYVSCTRDSQCNPCWSCVGGCG